MTEPRPPRVIIFPAGAEILGTNRAGDLVAATEDGAGTGIDLTGALTPGSLRFTTRGEDPSKGS